MRCPLTKDGDYFYNSVKIVELLEVPSFRRIIFTCKFADLNAQCHTHMCTLNFVSLKTAKLQHLHVHLTKVSPPRTCCMGTVFPQTFAAVRFYFKVQFGVATI